MNKLLANEDDTLPQYRSILRVNNSTGPQSERFCYINSGESYLPNVIISSYPLCVLINRRIKLYYYEKKDNLLVPDTRDFHFLPHFHLVRPSIEYKIKIYVYEFVFASFQNKIKLS